MKKFLILTVAFAAVGLVRAVIDPIVPNQEVGIVTAPISTGTQILSVPFEKCLNDGSANGKQIMLGDLVSTYGLIDASSAANADQLVALTTATVGGHENTPVYFYYYLKPGTPKTWTKLTTYVVSPPSDEEIVPTLEAGAFPISRGQGFWLKRPSGATETSLSLKGQIAVVNSTVTVNKQGLTLISLGAFIETGLNDISWGSGRFANNNISGMDKLIVGNPAGTFKEYYYHSNIEDGKWCTHNGAPTKTTDTIKPGYGLWYVRRDTSDLTFTPVLP
jgi:hypothetical protein